MQNNNNQKQKQHQDGADPTSIEKNVTDHEETATSTSPPPQVVYHSDVCSICQEDVCMLETTTFRIHTCCGKCMHTKCNNDLHDSNLSHETKNSCPSCRAKIAPAGSKEDIRRLRKWTQKKKNQKTNSKKTIKLILPKNLCSTVVCRLCTIRILLVLQIQTT